MVGMQNFIYVQILFMDQKMKNEVIYFAYVGPIFHTKLLEMYIGHFYEIEKKHENTIINFVVKFFDFLFLDI